MAGSVNLAIMQTAFYEILRQFRAYLYFPYALL